MSNLIGDAVDHSNVVESIEQWVIVGIGHDLKVLAYDVRHPRGGAATVDLPITSQSFDPVTQPESPTLNCAFASDGRLLPLTPQERTGAQVMGRGRQAHLQTLFRISSVKLQPVPRFISFWVEAIEES